MNFLLPEILSVLFHFTSLVLGVWVVYKHEGVFTRKEAQKKHRFCVDYIEVIYTVIVLSIMANLWFIYNQTQWIIKGYDKDLPHVVYLQWMWYHTVTGVVVSLLHLTIHWLLNSYKKNKKNKVKTNWKL